MKIAMMCDLRTLAPFLPPILITLVLICTFLTLGGGAVSAVGSVAVMMVLLCMFSFAGYDNQNGWDRYRATLPLSRREVIAGRYLVVLLLGVVGVLAAVVMGGAFQALFRMLPVAPAVYADSVSALLGASAVSMSWGLIICAVAMPLTVKFGAMRAMRLFACGLGIIASLGVAVGAGIMPDEGFAMVAAWIEDNLIACIVGCIAVSLVAYGASCVASVAIYERKDI